MAKQKATVENVDLVRTGPEIVIPANMSIDKAIQWLERKQREEEEPVCPDRVFDCYFTEGLVALQQALKDQFGWTIAQARRGLFGPIPEDVRAIPVGPDATVECTASPIEIPKWDGGLVVGVPVLDSGVPRFKLMANMKRKFASEFKELGQRVQQALDAGSIYKGKVVSAPEEKWNGKGQPEPCHFPQFLSWPTVEEDQLVLNSLTARALKNSVLGPIRFSGAMAEAGCSPKMGVLLEGPYGCGKTLTASVVATEAQRNGWTYILAHAGNVEEAYRFALEYTPAVVFCEDIDRVVAGTGHHDRSEELDRILNLVDGVEAKGRQIMLICTTNNVDGIHEAMLRPGRFDVVLSITPPDAKTVERLIRHYAGGLLDPMANLADVGHMLKGQIPATIREVVEKAKRCAVVRTQTEGVGFGLSAQDLVDAANEMLRHLNLLVKPEPDRRSDTEKALAPVAEAIKTLSPVNGGARKEVPYSGYGAY